MDGTTKSIPNNNEKDEAGQGGEEAKLKLLEEKEEEEETPIHGDVLEAILNRLTLLDLVAASHVSKSWRVAVSTSLRISPRVKPWFIVYTLNHRSHYLTSAYAFDPAASRAWLPIDDFGNFRHFNTTSSQLRSSHSQNLLYSFSASFFSFSFDPLHLTWHHAEAPLVWRENPIVARFGSRVLVAGGTCDYLDDPLAVEMYDSESRRWDMCAPMPAEFKDSATSTWLSTAATDRKLYLLEKRSLVICSFDAETKTWGSTFDLTLTHSGGAIPVAVFHSIIGFVNDRLVLVGLMGEQEELQGVGLWEVDQVTYECKEMGEMPPAMVESLKNGNSWLSTPCASMEGDLIYIYNPSNPEEIFFCELNRGKCEWGHNVNPMGKEKEKEKERHGKHRFVFTCSKIGMGDLEKAVAGGQCSLRAEDEIDGGIGRR